MISRQLLTVLKSEVRIVSAHPEWPGVRSAAHPQKMIAVCGRCTASVDAMSGPPDSEISQWVTCHSCGAVQLVTVMRGPLGGEG